MTHLNGDSPNAGRDAGDDHVEDEGVTAESTGPEPRALRFLTNHARALICVRDDTEIRIRDLASKLDITERRAQEIVSDLAESGYIERERVGRRNHYRVARTSVMADEGAEIVLGGGGRTS